MDLPMPPIPNDVVRFVIQGWEFALPQSIQLPRDQRRVWPCQEREVVAVSDM